MDAIRRRRDLRVQQQCIAVTGLPQETAQELSQKVSRVILNTLDEWYK
jgi:hypothetical protein